MPSVSPDNAVLTRRVAAVREQYRQFNTLLRGEVIELLNGLSNGTRSYMTMSGRLHLIQAQITDQLRELVLTDLNELSVSAFETASRVTGQIVSDVDLAVSESLMTTLVTHLSEVIDAQVKRDAQTVERFVKAQMVQGRFAVSSVELDTDLPFKHVGKGGRQIDADDFVYREVNWTYRSHYNTLMQMALLGGGQDRVIVDGGSKSGDVLDLMKLDIHESGYFHHNSKALLQPLD